MDKDRFQMSHTGLPHVFFIGVCWVVAYVALDYISFVDSYRGLAITPWNPAAGLALALVLLGGVRVVPVILIAPALAGALVRAGSVSATIHVIEGLAFGGSYLLAGMLARRYANIDLWLPTVKDTLMLMLTALGAAAMAAFGYVTVLRLAGLLDDADLLEALVRFVVGDLIGMLTVTPLVLLLLARRLQPVMVWDTLLVVLAVALAFAAVFAIPHASEYQLFYLLFVPLLWSAFRSGIAGAASTLCLIQVGLIVALQIRHGAMAELISFQILMISLAATSLVFGSLVGQQQATALRLRHQQLALSRALRLRSMGEIATVIAHEINQPITSIRTYAGITKEAVENANTERAIEAVARIRSECNRASSIIRATRESLRQQVTRPEQIKVQQLMHELRDLLFDRLGDIELAAEVSADAQVINGDPVQLKQALYNMIDNSIDAIEGTGEQGRITIAISRTARSQVEFAVRDTGPGFSSETSYFDIPPLVSTKVDGTGIGLSIARSVAEAHGGHLSIERDRDITVVKLRIVSDACAAHQTNMEAR